MIRPSHSFGPLFRKPARRDPAEDLQRKADRICSLIVASDYPDVDIDIEITNLRRWCVKHIPERRDLFELIYVNRFQRLREQFRSWDYDDLDAFSLTLVVTEEEYAKRGD